MAECPFCHEGAGLLKKEHEDCKRAHVAIADAVVDATVTGSAVSELDLKTKALATVNGRSLDLDEARREGLEAALTRILEDGVLDEAEEERLNVVLSAIGLDQAKTPKSWERIVKALSLRDVMAGKVPQRIRIDSMPVNLQKGERVAWAFAGTELLEQRVKRATRTIAHGLSIRIARGLYYRPGIFQSTPVERAYTASVGRGTLLITDRNLYFASSAKTVRIPYQKIVSFEPFADGMGVHREAASAKPQIFVTGDGWFTYNLASNLAQLR